MRLSNPLNGTFFFSILLGQPNFDLKNCISIDSLTRKKKLTIHNAYKFISHRLNKQFLQEKNIYTKIKYTSKTTHIHIGEGRSKDTN